MFSPTTLRVLQAALVMALIMPVKAQEQPKQEPATTPTAVETVSPEKREAKAASEAPSPSPSKGPSKADVQQSQKLFQRAMRLTSSETTLPEAFGLLEESSTLNPSDIATATAREFVRQELVSEHMERGNALMETSKAEEALSEFQQALALDPTNAFATQRLHDATALTKKPVAPRVYEYGTEPVLAPKDGLHTFTFRGDSKQLITSIGRTFGIEATFDASYGPRQVKVDLEDVDFYTALNIACRLSKCFYIPVSEKEMIIASDTQDVRRNLERMSLRTFYIPTEAGAQSMPEISNIVRTMLDLRFLSVDANQNTLTIRAPKKTLDAAALIIDNMTGPRPQVLLEIRALRLDESSSKQIGITYPLQFTMFNLNTEAQKLGPGAQGLINRFLAGTLTPQDLIAAQALLASGALSSSLLLKGFATVGGGIFKSGILVPPATLNFSMSHSLFQNVEHVILRASQGEAATFRVGDRIPVLTGSFTSILSALPGGQSIAGKGLSPIVPSFNYEDLGITLKATPQIGADSMVTMQLDMAIKALGGTTINDIPTISNRQYVGTITVRDGETSVIAGTVDRSETKGLSGIPWLSSLPGFGKAFGSTNTSSTSDQLLLLVTPHVLQLKARPDLKTEMYMDGN